MPGEHNQNQKLVGFWCDPDFLKEIDEARGFVGRSQFLRDAIVEKLKAMNIHIPREKTVAPDRAGKGGRPRKNKSGPVDQAKVNALVQDVVGAVADATWIPEVKGSAEQSGAKPKRKRASRQRSKKQS